MKKKTLIILLSILIGTIGLILVQNIIDIGNELTIFKLRPRCFTNTEYHSHSHEYFGIEISCRQYKNLVFDAVIKPFLTAIFNIAVELLLIYVLIAFIKREKLILNIDEVEKLEKAKIEKNEKKKKDKILQLTAKIEKLKEKDDE